jgi:hypothetical protein
MKRKGMFHRKDDPQNSEEAHAVYCARAWRCSLLHLLSPTSKLILGLRLDKNNSEFRSAQEVILIEHDVGINGGS